jgi:hypothetical protein
VLKWLGRLLLALLLALLVGLAIGTALRLRLERPVYYIGAADPRLGRFEEEGKLHHSMVSLAKRNNVDAALQIARAAPGSPTQGMGGAVRPSGRRRLRASRSGVSSLSTQRCLDL